ncbi:MAG: phenylalanine--tRNA ligase subunit beta [Bacteroidia bacterium]|nr:MAG: phenylalanine--tRNA ligase subunit beta [Bacteroidia bacterium]
MKISHNWLRQYIQTDLSAQEVGEILTNIGLEVEGMEALESVKGGLEGVVIGEVLSCEKHPDAEKLTICIVNLGESEPVQIVCGAPNVAAGQKVPVATVGTTLYPDDKGFTIKKAKIRGVHSMGMICAEDELGLGTSHDGIMVLDPGSVPGSPAAGYFKLENDIVFEIGLTPNRIDGASHLGVARDLAAYLTQKGKVQLTKPSIESFRSDNNDLLIPVKIEEKAGCKRYSALTISGVTVAESPSWLQHRLRSIGQTPINNVVDISNFVLHETGQPLHAFDAAEVSGNKVVVKTMPAGTPFVTLDEQERKLLSSDLVISNDREAMCIAGVFGGLRSGVTEKTTSIFLESACFDPVYIRKSAKHHQLNTDASFRFERGSDPNLTVWALKRAAMLIKEIAGGSITSEVVDVYPEPVEHFRVEISYNHVNRLIGNEISPDTIQSILTALEIEVEQRNDQGMVVRVPPYRVDVKREADVIEEILRIYGFNKVKIGTSLRSTLSTPPKPDKEKVINLCSDLLTSNGFFEMKSNSLTRTSYYDQGDQQDPKAVRISNPLSQDLGVMRQNLLFGGLEAVAWNINRKHPDLKLYEFGNCYYLNQSGSKKDPLEKYDEELHMGIYLSGKVRAGNWISLPVEASFQEMKTWVETVLLKLGIDPLDLETSGTENPNLDIGQAYLLKDHQVVEFGSIAADVLKIFDIKQAVFAAEFNWDLVLELLSGHRILFEPLPRFQVVTRDFSLMLDRKVTFESLRTLAFSTEKKLLKKVSLFDVYEGDKIEKGKKSYALSFTLLDEEKTLTDKQIDKCMLRIARAFESELGASVRGM